MHLRQVGESAGFDRAAWGSFSVYGVKPHLHCSTNRVPLSYELTIANVAEGKLWASPSKTATLEWER